MRGWRRAGKWGTLKSSSIAGTQLRPRDCGRKGELYHSFCTFVGGVFARLFASTIEQMLEAELTAHLGYEPYAPEGRNSGNSRNGKRTRSLRTSAGDTTITVPRDGNGSFHSPLLEPYQTSTNELEDKIIGLYAKGMSARDIQATLKDLYGVEVSAATISTITDKVWGLVEAWQNRPLATVYPIV
jgi:putative transposase